MAITIDWGTRVVNVPITDMVLLQSNPTTIYQLDLNFFRLSLKLLEESDAGMSYPDTHRHNTTVSIGGATLARVIEMINGYTVTFEDGQYAVNLVGANSNVGDVVNVNQVSVRSANSAGLQTVAIGSGLNSEQDQRLIDIEVALAAQGITLGAVDAKVDDLDTDVAAVDGKVDGVQTSVDGNQIAINDNNSAIASVDQSLQDKIDDVPTRVWNYTQ